MNQNEQDILKPIFSRMSEETLPPTFQPKMMERINKEALHMAKRNQQLQILSLIAASMMMIGLAVAAFVYLDLPQFYTRIPRISIPPSYVAFGCLVFVLLVADHLFRYLYEKRAFKKAQNQGLR